MHPFGSLADQLMLAKRCDTNAATSPRVEASTALASVYWSGLRNTVHLISILCAGPAWFWPTSDFAITRKATQITASTGSLEVRLVVALPQSWSSASQFYARTGFRT